MFVLKNNISALSIMLTLSIFLGGTLFLFSQEKTGNFSGVVTDGEENPLPGVTIVAWIPPAKEITKITTYNMISNSTGHFRFSNLPAGAYTVTFSLSGFKTVKKENIMVKSGQTFNLPVIMEIGAIEEEVSVIPVHPIVDQEKFVTMGYIRTMEAAFSMNDGEIERKIENLTKSIVNLRSIVNQLLKRVEDLERKLKASEEKIK